jgi:hypothetical protein
VLTADSLMAVMAVMAVVDGRGSDVVVVVGVYE